MPNKMRVQYLDPHSIKIPKVRISSAFDDDIYAMFKDDIKKTGINQPLLIARQGEDLFVIDGLHRLDEAKLNGLKTVPCVVVEMTLKDMQLRNLVLNRLRGKTKASEEVNVIRDLSENHGCGIEEIVDKTGMKRDRVEQLLQIGGADPEVWAALDNEEIKVCHAFQLSRLVDRSAQLRMLRIVHQYRSSCANLKEYVDAALQIIGERRKEETGVEMVQPPPIPTGTCNICKGEYPVRELSAPVLCRSCFAILITAYDMARVEVEREAQKKRELVEEVVGGESNAGSPS